MLHKHQSYDISASFLVPVYNLAKDIHSMHIITQKGQTPKGSISIDVWLVNASAEKPQQSMIESLKKEEQIYQEELDKVLEEEKPENDFQKSAKLRKLENDKAVFSKLVREAQDIVFHKQPDKEFLNIARRQFSSSAFSGFKLDLKNYLYLAGLSRYEER